MAMVAKIVLMVILTLIISGCKYRRKNTGNSDTGEGECCCKNNAEMAALAGCVCVEVVKGVTVWRK